MDYCLFLDTWLAGAGPEAASRELTLLGHRKVDWEVGCADLWQILGPREEWRELAVERVLHLLRFWVKFAVWDDDRASQYGRGEYVGTCKGLSRPFEEIDMLLPAFDEASSPRLRRLEERLASACPSALRWDDTFVPVWWLCAPKAFRFLERNLWQIGQGRRVAPTRTRTRPRRGSRPSPTRSRAGGGAPRPGGRSASECRASSALRPR